MQQIDPNNDGSKGLGDFLYAQAPDKLWPRRTQDTVHKLAQNSEELRAANLEARVAALEDAIPFPFTVFS